MVTPLPRSPSRCTQRGAPPLRGIPASSGRGGDDVFPLPDGAGRGEGGSGDEVWVADLGRVEYGAAYALQRRLALLRDEEALPDLLLLVEHPPVITLGRRGSRSDVFASEDELTALGIGLYETNRGGLVTY